MPASKNIIRQLVIILIISCSALRIFWELNTPTLIRHNLPHDDGLFMRLAMNIATGEWLGSFDQFTLMKGPGYPAFVALSAASGLPISATHAVFHVCAILISAWAIHRITGSVFLALGSFILLIFLPASFDSSLQNVFRAQIYWGQSIIVFSTIAIAVLAPPRRLSMRLLLGVVAGTTLAWAWLTREEGAWFIPGLFVLVLGGIVHFWLNRASLRPAIALVATMVAGFLAVQMAFMTANYFAYGAFVGVDFMERNFKTAYSLLQRIEAGERIPYVPVSAAARRMAAEHSPTFAALAEALRPGGPLHGWTAHGCGLYPQTCGEIAGGWFLWALRNAAALNGFYESPAVAAQKFGMIAHEIGRACDSGRLRCSGGIARYMQPMIPPMTAAQWWSLPKRMAKGTRMISLVDLAVSKPPLRAQANIAALNRHWQFLNFPKIVGPSSEIKGWYHDSTSKEWPKLQVTEKNVSAVPAVVERVPAPDLVQAFNDPDAAQNRFRILHTCQGECMLEATFADGATIAVPLQPATSKSETRGTRTILLDLIARRSHPASIADPRVALARQLTNAAYGIYKHICPALLAFGFLCYLAAAGRTLVLRRLQPAFICASGAWAFVITRIAVVALVDASSFPALHISHTLPATYLAAIGSILSIHDLFSGGWPRFKAAPLSQRNIEAEPVIEQTSVAGSRLASKMPTAATTKIGPCLL